MKRKSLFGFTILALIVIFVITLMAVRVGDNDTISKQIEKTPEVSKTSSESIVTYTVDNNYELFHKFLFPQYDDNGKLIKIESKDTDENNSVTIDKKDDVPNLFIYQYKNNNGKLFKWNDINEDKINDK